ncbi:MAG: hypothetical protein ACRCZP_07400, partial [Phycicoccus sp.]
MSSTHARSLVWREGRVVGSAAAATGAVRWWWAWAPPGVGAGTVTVTLDGVPTIHDVEVFEVTGVHPERPVGGRGARQETTSPTVSATLDVSPAATDLILGLVMNRNGSTAPTPGAGFTTASSAASASPSASYLIQHRTGTTSTTVGAAGVGAAWSGVDAASLRSDDGTRTPRWRVAT